MTAHGSPRDLGQLLRLRELRVAAAAELCTQRRRELEAAVQAIERRQARIAEWRRSRDELARQVVGPASADIARFAASVSARRAYLDDQLERDEYALLDDEHEHRQALQRLEEAQALWQRERAREDGVHDLVGEARVARERQREHRAELEAEERTGRPMAAAMGVST